MSQVPSIVFLAGLDSSSLTDDVLAALSASRIEVQTFGSPAEAAGEVERRVSGGESLPCVVVLNGADTVAAARRVQKATGSSHLIFVARWDLRESLQRELRLVSLRSGWSFALPDATLLTDAIRNALNLVQQRRQLRTTLDRSAAPVRSEDLDPRRVRDLVLSDAVLAAILRDAVDSIVAVDSRGRFLSANPAAQRLFGASDEQLRASSIADLVPSLKDIESFVGKASNHSIVRRDGDRIPIDVTVSRVLLPSGPAGYAIIARDARERIEAEDELRRQAEFTATIADGIGDGVYVIDAFGNLLFMNPAAEEILGWKRKELADRNIHDTIHALGKDGGHVPAGRCPLLQAVRSGVALRQEDETFVRKDGSELPVECVVTPVRFRGQVIGGVFTFHDISQHRRLREELIGEKESLARLNREKDEFLATISHELRTPITAILGWLQRATSGELHENEMREALEAIETSARTQAQIVNDLLDVSRVISGKLHLSMSNVDLNEVVAAAFATLRPSADAKGISFVMQPAPREIIVCGDASRLHQIVWNLVSNAVKFTPEGGTVSVTVQDGGATARLIVKDTGIGIPQEVIPVLFQKYRQADGGAEKGGLGLGLAIVKSLLERHNGTIEVKSEVGAGTTITVELPRSAADSAATASS